jgi:hypothetical protein
MMNIKDALHSMATQYPVTSLLVLGLLGKEVVEGLTVMPSKSCCRETIYSEICSKLEMVDERLEVLIKSLPFTALIDLHFFVDDEDFDDHFLEKYGQKYYPVMDFMNSLFMV